ncbi:MAG TPA: GNAT family protein, partial [Rhodanobacteraceae bacterium]|nr:GNAT family protein [Rhodanobacteraceae bacterium]
PRNVASARSLERLGFAKEGLLRQRWIVDGEVSDSALYGLLLGDWQSQLERDAGFSLRPVGGYGAGGGCGWPNRKRVARSGTTITRRVLRADLFRQRER